MSPSFNIFCIFVFANLYGLCVLYANWTKERLISSIKCKHILIAFCFNWIHFMCPMYCTNFIWDWFIYILDSNIPKKPAQDKNLLTWNLSRKWLKIEYKFEHVQIKISYVHETRLCTSLEGLFSWISTIFHHSTTCSVDSNRSAWGFIWYLRSAHFTHAPAPSCFLVPWPVSKKFQHCVMFDFLWRWNNQ